VCNRMLLIVISILFGTIYSNVNLAVIFGLYLAYIGKIISGIFLFIFAWNVAMLVQLAYNKYLESKK